MFFVGVNYTGFFVEIFFMPVTYVFLNAYCSDTYHLLRSIFPSCALGSLLQLQNFIYVLVKHYSQYSVQLLRLHHNHWLMLLDTAAFIVNRSGKYTLKADVQPCIYSLHSVFTPQWIK